MKIKSNNYIIIRFNRSLLNIINVLMKLVNNFFDSHVIYDMRTLNVYMHEVFSNEISTNKNILVNIKDTTLVKMLKKKLNNWHLKYLFLIWFLKNYINEISIFFSSKRHFILLHLSVDKENSYSHHSPHAKSTIYLFHNHFSNVHLELITHILLKYYFLFFLISPF